MKFKQLISALIIICAFNGAACMDYNKANGNSLVRTATAIVLKEPIRIIQFYGKTRKLEKNTATIIPIGFKAATVSRFISNMAVDGCLLITLLNSMFESPFLSGWYKYLAIGVFGGGELVNSLSRAVVRNIYPEISELYNEDRIKMTADTTSSI